MIEKERKFLINSNEFMKSIIIGENRKEIVQMYIVDKEDHSLRIRIINNTTASICYKYYLNDESKEEHEYIFSLEEANRIYDNNEYDTVLYKIRVVFEGWDIDYYPDLDLRVAEFEFTDDNPLPNPLPNWIGEEVTGQYEYSNPAIAKK